MSKILVTGAAGFIGSAVAEKLASRGESVVGLDNLNDYYPVALKRARLDRVRAKCAEAFEFIELNFADMDSLEHALAAHDIRRIVHLGAQAGVRYSLSNPHAYVQSNLVGHVNILEFARSRETKHLVYASSSSVYGANEKVPFAVADRVDRPVSLYAATKRADELLSESYASLYRLPQTGLRFFTVYGPWGRPDMMPWLFTERILRREPIQVFNHGRMQRDFTYIDDIVAGVEACLDLPPGDTADIAEGGSGAPHAIYNIGNNRPEELLRIINILEEACGRKAIIEMMPMQKGDVPRTYADIDSFTERTGYRPSTSADVGFPRFVDWFKRYHDID